MKTSFLVDTAKPFVKTIKIKLVPTLIQQKELIRLSKEYISQANILVKQAFKDGSFPNVTSKNIDSSIPSVCKNELIRYAKSKYKQFGNCTFKKKTVSWNNQNYTVLENALSFPIMVNGKSKRTPMKAIIPTETYTLLSNSKLGSLRVSKKGRFWIASIAVEQLPVTFDGNNTLGIDLGILCPAVGVVSATGKTKFFGNGRKNKFIRRKYKELRKTLGKDKKVNAIKKINDKESRIMRDTNHKISRDIVNFAIDNNCGVINLENLSGIRQTSKARGKKARNNLHNWSFFELSTFIEYKAYEKGIKVLYVDPKYTSQICPSCGEKNKTTSRNYTCKECTYHTHRDRVGAINIANSIGEVKKKQKIEKKKQVATEVA